MSPFLLCSQFILRSFNFKCAEIRRKILLNLDQQYFISVFYLVFFLSFFYARNVIARIIFASKRKKINTKYKSLTSTNVEFNIIC